MDRFSPQQRSLIMSRVRSKNTVPEMIVRRLVHGMGFRYRLHDPSLPGKPDMVFRRLRKVIFVNGCFFHAHDCASGTIPKSNRKFWRDKLAKNAIRDRSDRQELAQKGWRVLTVWQCELSQKSVLKDRLRRFLVEGGIFGNYRNSRRTNLSGN